MHSGSLVVALRRVETREAALAMKGFEVGVPRTALPAAAQGEIYWEDLTGLAVVNRTGVLLGEVRGIVAHGAHPLLRVARPARRPAPSGLIPYVPAIIDGSTCRPAGSTWIGGRTTSRLGFRRRSMRIDVVTLFPEMVEHAAKFGVTGRALQRGLWRLGCGIRAIS